MKTSPAIPFDRSNIEPVEIRKERAKDLRIGDVLTFHDRRLLCLGNVYNELTPAVTTLVTIPVDEDWPSKVVALRLYSAALVVVDGKVRMAVEFERSTPDEIENC